MYYVLQRIDTGEYEGDMTLSKPNWVTSLDDAFEYGNHINAYKQAQFYSEHEPCDVTVVLINSDSQADDCVDFTFRTWHLEMIAVATLLLAVLIFSGFTFPNVITTLAGLAMFGYVQVMHRVTENKNIDLVECHRWAVRYLVSKEVLWIIYFVAVHNWSALVSTAIFILYPVWRSYYTKLRQ
jgi:hypothetical protein